MQYAAMNRCRIAGSLALIALAASLTAHSVVTLAGTVLAPRPTEPTRATVDPAADVEPVCDLRHPIDVQVEALDAPRRGRPLQARVVVSPEFDLSNVRIDLVSAGGALPAGATRALLGEVGQGRNAAADFSVRLPAAGHRFLLQFVIQGDGPNGPISRMATYNVLPDGPLDAGRTVVTPAGEKIREYAARRIQ
jgi:hypothetical protein